ncbi:MAG: hypothetical protein AAGN35_28290 [Bacteroidota bacterium]
MKDSLGKKLLFTAFVFMLPFSYPLIGLFDGAENTSYPFGFFAFFAIWAVLVIALRVAVTRKDPDEHE